MNLNYHIITVRRIQESAVIIGLPHKRLPTREEIKIAADTTLTPEEWDVEGDLEIGKSFPMPEAKATEYRCYCPSLKPTFADRAAEIGVSEVTLRTWRRDHGVDVFDDAAVKAHVIRQKNHNWKIAAKFKARLSQ